MPKRKPKYRDHLLPITVANEAAFKALLQPVKKVDKLDNKYAWISAKTIFDDLKL